MSLPRNDQELGEALRRLRGSRSLRDLAEAVRSSRSALSRMETGQQRMSPELAKCLDSELGASGFLFAALRNLQRGSWSPWGTDQPTNRYVHAWPAEFAGQVWVAIQPELENVSIIHDVMFNWGPWKFHDALTIDRNGAALITDKALDETRAAIIVACNLPVFVDFGMHEPPEGFSEIDIRWRWRRREE